MKVTKVKLTPAEVSLDMGDGSERAFYVNQDYILRRLNKLHRGISLMYTYYPKEPTWPTRASIAFPKNKDGGAWNFSYEDYFPYEGGLDGTRDGEPFKFMKEIRQRGMDVVLTLTIDPKLEDKYLISVAKDLRPYGRILLRVNHECTGNWFCYDKRASYQELADFFVRVANIMHEYAPNVKIILCAGMYEEETGKLEMEDIFLEAHKVADIWSGDNYLSLHWGWPNDIAEKENALISHSNFGADTVYKKAKATLHRLREITGQDKPFVLSELNADGDVAGAFEQAQTVHRFMELLEKDKEKWLSAFTLYQFRDDGRLGLEITDPNNPDVGIEQPGFQTYKQDAHKDFFSAKSIPDGEIELPAKLRWGGSEDAEGVEIPLHFEKAPVFAELYFKDKLVDMNLVIEFGGYWFYKKPGNNFVDLMTYFFENPVRKPKKPFDMKLHIYCPPESGLNMPENGEPDTAPDGDWMTNYYTVLPSLPEIRLRFEEPFPSKK